eukprot:scaffold249881_cov50-Prasinocladus_malaysianus.AAC.1
MAAMQLFGQPQPSREEMEKGDVCPICLSAMADMTVYETECGHRYHHCCITGWLNMGKSSACPMCRKHISLRVMSEALWQSQKYEFAVKEDVEENLEVIRKIIRKVDEQNRNFCSRVVKIDGVEIPYFITGQIRMLMESHKSLYYIVFVWEGKVYEAHVDTSQSIAYFMRLTVKLLDSVEFEIQYVDH